MTTLRGGKAPWATLLSALSACTGNVEDEAVTLTAVDAWTTEAEYEFGDRFDGDALFGLIVDVAVTPDGSRIYVLDSRATEVTIWTPKGNLIRRFGREGEGPGEFRNPGRFYLYDDSLVVREWRRGLTTFSLDGDFIGWHAIPPFVSWRGFSFSYESLLADGSFLVTPVVGGMISEGLTGDDPIHEIPWLRVAQETGSWSLDTVALRSDRNTTIVFPGTGTTVATFFDQPWVRKDACQGDGRVGSVVCARTQTMPPGVVDLVEVSVGGDTVWTRRIQLEPLPIGDREYEEKVDWMASIVSRDHGGDSVASPLMRRRVREKLANPGFWPAIRGIRLMSNGEVWFRRLKEGASHVWYAARRGETEGPIRQIVLPENFKPRFVDDTHVWGDRSDELGVTYVAGRRLMPTRE
ncbi:MAG: 6-bladed beta-propeller [Gemmatimonadota bacterium]|nr:6-bladed beta-propeller [Gemmatimonadota bacterium]